MQESRKKEIRIKTDSFREKCKVSRYGIIDLFKECERRGYKLFRYPLGEEADLGFTLRKDSPGMTRHLRSVLSEPAASPHPTHQKTLQIMNPCPV